MRKAIGPVSLLFLSAVVSCRRAGPTGPDPAPRPHPFFLTEADDPPQPKNASGSPTDFLERHSRLVAGPNGIDCGQVAIGADPAHATKCALHAQAKGKPFRVRYGQMGADSNVALAMVRSPSGSCHSPGL